MMQDVVDKLNQLICARPSKNELQKKGIMKKYGEKFESEWDSECDINYNKLPIGIKSIIVMHCKCCHICFKQLNWNQYMCGKCAQERIQKICNYDIVRLYPHWNKYGMGYTKIDEKYGIWGVVQCRTGGWNDYTGANCSKYTILLIHIPSKNMCQVYFSETDTTGVCNWILEGTEIHQFDNQKMHSIHVTHHDKPHVNEQNNKLNLKSHFESHGFKYNEMLWICQTCDGPCNCPLIN
eukprot:100139_1